MGAKGVKRPDLPCERSPPGGSSSLRSTAAEASTHITLKTTGAIAALTRRMHRMPISCQRGRVLRRFRQNACRVDTQNAQNADFLSTRPRCCRWEAQKASTHITLKTTRAITALTRRTHRMPISCQRGRVLRRFRQNACRVDTQNAQNAIFLSTRPRCCRWEAQNVASPATFCLSTCDSPPQYGG